MQAAAGLAKDVQERPQEGKRNGCDKQGVPGAKGGHVVPPSGKRAGRRRLRRWVPTGLASEMGPRISENPPIAQHE